MNFISTIPFLATAIAIIISWALFAILCSLTHEAIAQLLAERGRFMKKYMLKQLQDLPNGINWGSLLYLHGSVDILTRADNKPTNNISPELFSKTLIDVVGSSHLVQTRITALKEIASNNTADTSIESANNYTHSALYNFKAAVQLLKPSDLVGFFTQSLKDAELRADVNPVAGKLSTESEVYKLLAANIESWYKEFSDRLSLWYKKFVRQRLFMIGILLGIIVNVDSIQLFNFYKSNPDSRAAVISYYQNNADQLSRLANSTDSMIRRSAVDTSGGLTDTAAQRMYRDSVLQVSRKFIQSADSLRKAANLPVGFDNSIFKTYKHEPWKSWVWKLIGILITGFAASFGAPFWFDILRKAVR